MDARLSNNGKYTRQQLLDGYQSLARTCMKCLFGKDWTPALKIADGISRIDELTQELEHSSGITTLKSLRELLKDLGNHIVTLITGEESETVVDNYLDMLEIDNLRLRNIGLRAATKTEEFDEIVITPKFVVIIEAKWRRKFYKIDKHGRLLNSRNRVVNDLASRTVSRHHVLRTILTEAFGAKGKQLPIIEYLVFTNEKARVVDQSNLLSWCSPGEMICSLKRAYAATAKETELDLADIKEALESRSLTQTFKPAVDVDAMYKYVEQLTPKPKEDEPWLVFKGVLSGLRDSLLYLLQMFTPRPSWLSGAQGKRNGK